MFIIDIIFLFKGIHKPHHLFLLYSEGNIFRMTKARTTKEIIVSDIMKFLSEQLNVLINIVSFWENFLHEMGIHNEFNCFS